MEQTTKRPITIDIDSKVFADLMKEFKNDELRIKRVLEDDISFIYDHYRLARLAKQQEEESNSDV